MFKIENYITPLILSKVEKFVKNVKKEELQLSLWEGEVVFQNLELRLDVLEEELQLPFTFLSGHINDLKIMIPWTKISSEPITITINTIEFVLKLKDFKEAASIPKPKIKKKLSVDEDGSAGYMASLINKILNNISVVCNNIVLKYVEEDIVISMNIQHLSIHSADQRWKRAFIDVSPTKVLFRKLVNIIDLTICLDKRNSSGKIEYCQEPILYKCSMELRLFRKYTASAPHKLSLTRIDIQTNSLNLSISSQQFPMLIRLYDLIMALKSGKLQAQSLTAVNADPSAESNENPDDESWVVWMWNMMPNIFPEEQSHEHIETNDKKIFEFGFYAEDIRLMFKSQEFLTDTIIPSTKKLIFKPLLEFHMQEVYAITIICGVRKFNVKGGIGFIEINALDECPCGTSVTDPLLLVSGSRNKLGHYLKDSFMDKNANSLQIKYEDMWTNYYEKHTEDYLLSKTPAIAMDILHSLEIPDDTRSSDMESDFEYSNFSESYTIRVFGNNLKFSTSAEMIHRMEKLLSYYNDSDYLPYIEEEKPLTKQQLPRATADDYEALLSEVPLKVIRVKIKDLSVLVRHWDHDNQAKTRRKLHKNSSAVSLDARPNVFFEFKIAEAQQIMTVPLYKNRLIYTVCQLPDTKDELFDKCFMILETKLKNTTIYANYLNLRQVATIGMISGNVRKLLYPYLWVDLKLEENLYALTMDDFQLNVNAPQLLAIQTVVTSMRDKMQDTSNEFLDGETLDNLENEELVVLEMNMSRMKLNASVTDSCYFGRIKVSNLKGSAYKFNEPKKKTLILNWPDQLSSVPSPAKSKKPKKVDLLLLLLQIPKDIENSTQYVPVVTLKLTEGFLNFDPLLKSFLSFTTVKKQQHQRVDRFMRQSSCSTKQAQYKPSIASEKSNIQLPSIHSSSDCDITVIPIINETEKEDIATDTFNQRYQTFRRFVFDIDMKTFCICYTLNPVLLPVHSIANWLESDKDNEIVAIRLPNIICHSVKNKSYLEKVQKKFPFELPANLWSNEKTYTWKLELNDASATSIDHSKIFSFIDTLSMNVALADASPINENANDNINFAGILHFETSPVTLTFHTSQVTLLKSCIDDLTFLPLLQSRPNLKAEKKIDKSLTVIHESPKNTSEIKEFLGYPPHAGSTTTKTSLIDDKIIKKVSTKNSLFVQWMCSKITLILHADNIAIQKKFILDIDDIFFSLNKHDYYQLRSKIATISGSLYEKESSEDEKWMKNITLGLSVQSEENVPDNVNTFLDVVVTKAETDSVHDKWDLNHKKFRKNLFNDDITEITVNMQPLDLVLNFDELMHFMPIFVAMQSKSQSSEPNIPQSGSELPLIYMKFDGIRVFLPCLGDSNQLPNVLIIKVNELRVTPKAENNVSRKILRPDIHSKAISLSMLDLVGSVIEDRQYQLILNGFSLSTSNWDGIAALINEKTISHSYDNPAFEWNNLENGPKSPNFKLNTIFKDMKFSLIYAPCIRFKQTLVAGTAIEANFVTDLNIDVNLKELALFINISNYINTVKSLLKTSTAIQSQPTENQQHHDESFHEEINEIFHFDKRKPCFEKKSFDDSGIGSFSQSNKVQDRKLWRKKVSVGANNIYDPMCVPSEITFTSSHFTIKCSSKDDVFLVFFDSPNVYVCQSSSEKFVVMSLHDLNISVEGKKHKHTLFSTKEGETDASGFKQSLIRIKYTDKATKNTECDVQIKRPMKIVFSHRKLQKTHELIALLNDHLIVGSQKQRQLKEILINGKKRKFDVIKSHLQNIRNFNFSTNQIVFELMSRELYDFKLSLDSVKSKFKIFDRPEKIELCCELNNFVLLNRGHVVLHPLSLQIKMKIVQEYWKRDPLIHINFNSNYMRVDLSVDLLKEYEVCRGMFSEVMEICESSAKEWLKSSKEKVLKIREYSEHIQINYEHFHNDNNCTVEHYQDDLRAGAFQFVEISSQRDLPLPYQIQIIDKEMGVICWRYPQPRALHKIKIFPVPFQTTNQVTIICKIEFYSQLKMCFEEYCEFALTENETKILDLKNNRPSSEIWRIKIPRVFLKKDSDDEDDEPDYEFKMHPKVLVACLRIDSFFVSNIIPNIDVFADIEHMELNVLNKISKYDVMPEMLKNYNLLDDSGKEHKAIQVMLDNVKLYGQFYDENYMNFEVDSVLSADIIDYSCSNMVQLLEKVHWKSLVDIHHYELNLHILTDKIHFKYGPSIGHSLLATKNMWDRNMNEVSSNPFNNQELIMHTKYLICNNTVFPVGVNQVNTNEMICLMPQTCALYSFRTDKLEQQLEFCICNKKEWTEKSNPIYVHREMEQFLKLSNNQYFIVTVKNITSVQRKITINGQIAIFNMSKEIFRVQYKRYDKDIDAADKCETDEFDLDSHKNVSVFGTCQQDSQQSIRLRILNNEKKGFSGEIPLREIVKNNKPWLVKVPSITKGGHTSFWVRILRQTLAVSDNEDISRVLVMIWPLFVMKSLLPIQTTAFEAELNQKYTVFGRGEIKEFEMAGTHEDDHELLFQGDFMATAEEKNKITLSYNFIDKNSFFRIPEEYSDVSKAIEKLESKHEEHWPCDREEELRCNRENSPNGATLPLYSFSSPQPEELSCSLMLTLAPWCLIINSTGCMVKLTNSIDKSECLVEPNNTTMPFHITESFTISAKVNTNWSPESDPIYVKSDIKKTVSNSQTIPGDGHIVLNIHSETDIVQLLVTSIYKNKMRVMIISTAFVIANRTSLNLNVFAFAADSNDRVDVMKKGDISGARQLTNLYSNLKGITTSCVKGNPIVSFRDLTKNKMKRKHNTSYTAFIAICVESNELSCPIKFQPLLRKCVNVFTKDGNISLSLSIIKHQDQYFMTIYEDLTPYLAVQNTTDFHLYIAQTDLSNPNTKTILPHKEIDDERFLWFQTVGSKQKVFYTPPSISERFPEINSIDYGLIFACVSGDDNIRWSQPIKIDETKRIIFNVPMFGDLKLNIDMRFKTLQISISYIASESITSIDQISLKEENSIDSTTPFYYIKNSPSRESYRSSQKPSFLEINSNYQKSFKLSKKKTMRGLNVNFFSKGINLTLFKDADPVTAKRTDLISLNVDEIGFQYSKLACKVNLNFASIQVDNELYNNGEYDFPVVLCNKIVPKSSLHSVAATSVWDLVDILEKQEKSEDVHSVDLDLYENDGSIENILVKVQPIRVYVEDTFINVLLDIVDECIPANLIHKNVEEQHEERINLPNELSLVPKHVVDQANVLAEPIRFKNLRLEPLHVLLSVHTCIRMYIALDHSPLDFSAYEKTQIYSLPMKFGNSIGMHYLSSAIFGAGWVVGSLEILGSPSGLARSFTSGIVDFVSMPVQGLFKGPWGFVVGLTQGSASLVRNVTTGTVNSVTKLANSVARNLDRLTLDSDHIHLKTDNSRRHRPQGLTDGFQQGLTGFGISILGAVGGLARHPLQARSTMEVFTGVGKGIVGVFAKPISGAAEFLSLTGQGMLQSVGYNTLPLPMSTRNISMAYKQLEPTPDKIISKQLPQLFNSNLILFSCRATFVRKNDLKNSFIILLSTVLVIVDLDRDTVMEVIGLEKVSISKLSLESADNLFLFKIKNGDVDSSPKEQEIKYPVSSRTVQYVKELSGHQLHHIPDNKSSDNSDDEDIPNYPETTVKKPNEFLNVCAINNERKFYIEEVAGKYLISYINLIKTQTATKDVSFSIF